MSAEGKSRIVKFSVPPVDVSASRWLDEQYSISESLRQLIREAIQREGYVDVVNKPVEQLPRRGRPPRQQDDDEGDEPELSSKVEGSLPDDEADEREPGLDEGGQLDINAVMSARS